MYECQQIHDSLSYLTQKVKLRQTFLILIWHLQAEILPIEYYQ